MLLIFVFTKMEDFALVLILDNYTFKLPYKLYVLWYMNQIHSMRTYGNFDPLPPTEEEKQKKKEYKKFIDNNL